MSLMRYWSRLLVVRRGELVSRMGMGVTNGHLKPQTVHVMQNPACLSSPISDRANIQMSRQYYWRRKLNPSTPAMSGAPDSSNFVALCVAHTPAVREVAGCMLVMPSGLHFERSSLPSAQWLVALNHTMQSVPI